MTTGVDIVCLRIGGNGQWHLPVSVTDNNKITGNGRLIDVAVEFGKDVARQRRRRLQSAVAAVGD